MQLDQFAARLKKPKSKTIQGRPGYIGCCPAHEDDKPSFAVWEGRDGWLHMKCQKGCPEGSILGALGLSSDDRRISERPPGPTQEAVYIYTNAEGKTKFEKVRLREPDGKKTFRIRSQDSSGRTVYTTAHLNGWRGTLYNWPEVVKAIATGKTIYVNEGEKACEEMKKAGLVATCQPVGGEGSGSKWLPEHTNALRGANVVVIADRDEVGEAYARAVAGALRRTASSVYVMQSATTNPKDDAFDHFKAGFGPTEFIPRPDLVLPRALPGVTFDETAFTPTVVEYLWEPYFPKGKMILLDADGGTGKTSLLVAIAAGLSVGHLPITGDRCNPLKTAYFHKGEDRNDELATVYKANGGAFCNIRFFDEPDLMFTEDGLSIIEDTIEAGDFKFIVFDALFYFFVKMGLGDDAWKNPMSILPVLQRLTAIAARTGCTIVNIRHTRKGVVDAKASELGFGTVQFRNSHRGQLVARWHPDSDYRGIVVVTDEKGSILVRQGEPFAFRRSGLEVQYVHGIGNPFEHLVQRNTLPIARAKALIRKLTSGGGRFFPAEQFLDAAEDEGINKRTLDRARQSLGIATRQGIMGTGWTWILPEAIDPLADDEE